MSTMQTTSRLDGAGAPSASPAAASALAELDAAVIAAAVDAMFDVEDKREKFIPITRQALMERLSHADGWPAGEATHVRRFFNYLNQWRQQSYGAKLLDLERSYEPFSPDSDLLVTRRFSSANRRSLGTRLMGGVCDLLRQANYTRIDPSMVDMIMTKDSAYGLDLHVDLDAFDELEIWYRGVSSRVDQRRTMRKFYLHKEEFDVPIFQRLAIVFKLKDERRRIQDLMAKEGLDFGKAERRVQKMRGLVSDLVKPDFIYLKLFKNIPRADLEMVFPNTRIKFRLFDKIRLGVTAGGGLGMGVAGTVGKIAIATNPIALAGAVAGLGGIAVRQVVAFTNQRNKYMVTMAQNLYSHAMADNRGVMTLLAERAAEEDLKEEILLYSLLAKEEVYLADLKLADAAVERYLSTTFGVDVNFDVEDALHRLKRDGIVTVMPNGRLKTLPPAEAWAHIDMLWDRYLDDLPDLVPDEGYEYEGEAAQPGGMT